MCGKLEYLLTCIFLCASFVLAKDHFTWVLEILWVVLGLALFLYYSKSGTYVTSLLGHLLFIHALILIVGGIYTYERVPLGYWMQDWFGFERNHYDRIGHFFQGFTPAILAREILIRNEVVLKKSWLGIICFAFCVAFSGLFEVLEFAAAVAFGSGADSFLGSQGDVWDAQWDISYCSIGAILSLLLLSRLHDKALSRMESE